ncbi:MAG: hypothetical protein WCO00_16215 [Rhodospirillaceae bacterium]
MRTILLMIVLACTLVGGDAAAQQNADLFKTLPWGASVESVRKYFTLIGPVDIGGKVNVYTSPDNPFGDLYGDLILNFHAGKLTRFRVFLGDHDSGDRFRAVLKVMHGASAWNEIYLKLGSVEIPLLVKPVTDPFKPPPPPPKTFTEAKSMWIESPISDEAVYIFKQSRQLREMMKSLIAKNTKLRGALITLHKGFVAATFAPARDLIQELDQTGDESRDTLIPKGPESKDLELLMPLAPK